MSRSTASKISQHEPAQQEGASSPAYSIQPGPAGPRAAILALQRTAGNRAVSRWLQSTEANSALDGEGPQARLTDSLGGLSVMLQTKPANGSSGNPAEQQADRAAAAATHQPEAEVPARALLVEDEAEPVQSGQMRKSEFLSELKSSVCSAAEEALRDTIWSAMGCPYIERWLSHYSNQSSQHVERAIRKYAPETASVRTAREYIPLVTQRVQRGIAEWARTGEVTGVPEELAQGGMPGVSAAGLMGGLVGGALSAVGGAVSGLVGGAGQALSGAARALFKGRAGGAREVEDPAAIHSQLGSGRALDDSVRARMESAYGVDFSRVRVHTNTRSQELSDGLNARAFTIGRDIAFGAGEYQPGTLIGDALIAHELAHVVQQGGGSTAGMPLQKGGDESNALEEEADASAVGAMVAVRGGLRGTFGDIGHHAMPRLRSGLRLQRCASSQKKVPAQEKAALSPKAAAESRFRSEKLVAREKNLAEAGALMRGVGTWAAAEQRKQNRPVITGVVGLDPKQRESASQAVIKLKSVAPLFDTAGLDGVSLKLQEATTHARGAKKYVGREEPEFRGEMRLAFGRAGDLLDEAVSALEKLRDSVDGYELWGEIEKARETLEQAKAGNIDTFDGIDKFSKYIKDIRETIRDMQQKYKRYPQAIARIAFVLQNFAAVNSPGFAGAPSAEEVKKFRGTLQGSLGEDFTLIFGGSGVHSPFELFISYANILDKQLAVREKMEAAGKPAKTLIPTQGEVESYFKALGKKPNQEVVDAYEQYARAYFFHRIVVNIEDMNVTGVADLYARSLSITGTRPLVCSGYAILGAHLLSQAGAKVVRFITAVRATDDDLLNNTIDDGHALAQLTRNGEQFFVSNDLVVKKEKDGIGPDAVAWTKKDAPLHKASGSTNAAALAALIDQLAKKRQALEQKSKGKAK
jgi:uncharacterized protein DUF4157